MKFNLLSVSRIANKGFKIKIDRNVLEVYDKGLVLRAQQMNKLYTLELKLETMDPHQALSAEIWHRRLGHLNRNNMKILGLPYSNEKCNKCIEGKACRLPFTRNYKTTRRIGELIHTDLCGPITPETLEGHKYFQVIIDDYSYFTKVYY